MATLNQATNPNIPDGMIGDGSGANPGALMKVNADGSINTVVDATGGSPTVIAGGDGSTAASAANPLPVSSAAPTDTYPAGGNITTQDIASVTVQGQFNQNQTTGTPTAASSITFAIAGYTTVSLGLTGTWTGTLTLEGATAPGGVTGSTVWTNKTCRVPGSTLSTSIFTANASDVLCNVAGYTHFRVRATAAMTGTAVVGAVAVSINFHALDLINPLKIVDGSGTSNTLTIKAASTTPLATDTAVVVSLGPNSAATPTIGVNGTSIATLANPFPASVNGVNGTGVSTVTNPLPTFEPDGGSTAAPVSANSSGTATSAIVLFTLDTSGYNGISIQVTSPGTTCTITYEQSNDNSTWQNMVMQGTTSTSQIGNSQSSTANIVQGVFGSRWFRARVSTYTSGTVTAFYSLRRSPALNNFSLTSILGANGSSVTSTANPLPVQVIAATTGGYSFTNISTNATTTAKSGAGTLHTITVNNPGTTETLTIYDNTAGSGTKIGTVAVGTSLTTLIYDLAFATGLTIVSAGAGAGDWTVTWK